MMPKWTKLSALTHVHIFMWTLSECTDAWVALAFQQIDGPLLLPPVF